MRAPIRRKRESIISENLRQATDEDKELILNIAFISSFLIDDETSRKKEIERILKLARENGISIANLERNKKEKKQNGELTNSSIKDIVARDKDIVNAISEKDLLDLLVNLASDIEIFDNQDELKALLEFYRTDILLLQNKDISSRESEMKYTAKDNEYQYYSNNISKVEIFANAAWLSNKLAHFFEKIQKSKWLFATKKQLDLQKSLMRIKDFCIHRVIAEKQLGADVEINVFDDFNLTSENRFHQVFSISLPHYLQPIMLHFPSDELSSDERKACSDEIMNNIYQDGVSAIFPLKLTPEKEELLSYLMKNVYNNRTNQLPPHIARLKWFFANNLDRKNILNKPTTLEKGRTLKEKENLSKLFKENTIFLEELSKDLGIEFPNYFLDKLLLKSKYSFSAFMNKIDPYARKVLRDKGISEENLDIELKKLFIHMKVMKPVSTLRLEKSDGTNIKAAIDDSADKYKLTFDFIKENLSNFRDYQSMKIALNRQIKKQEVLDKEELKRQEIQALLDKLSTINQQISLKEKELVGLDVKRKQLKKELKELAKESKTLLDRLNENYKE